MSNLLLLGAGGHGRVAAEIAILSHNWDKISYLDDNKSTKSVNSIPIIGTLEEFRLFKEDYSYAFVAIGNNSIRLRWLHSLMEEGFNTPVLIHPYSFISKTSGIGEGTIVMAGAVINAGSKIGNGCIINTSSSIDHDCIIGDGVHISPGVNIGGYVGIGRLTWVCIGSKIINNIRIGQSAIIAAGSVVTKNIPDNVMAAGVPAVIKKSLYR
jgi:sugar O-acyltransferase (sialic acid O-acetyltransferase NeuD family)